MKCLNIKTIGILTKIFIILILHHPVATKENEGAVLKRTKRQFELEQGNQVIDSIFQIPIQTLTAVSNLWKNTRPITYRIRQQVLNQYQQYASRPGFTAGGYYPSDYASFQRPAPTIQRPNFYNVRKTKTKIKTKTEVGTRKKPSLDIDE